MLFAQIEHLSFMRAKLIRPNFGMFFLFMLGWTMILVMFKVSFYKSSSQTSDIYEKMVMIWLLLSRNE